MISATWFNFGYTVQQVLTVRPQASGATNLRLRAYDNGYDVRQITMGNTSYGFETSDNEQKGLNSGMSRLCWNKLLGGNRNSNSIYIQLVYIHKIKCTRVY